MRGTAAALGMKSTARDYGHEVKVRPLDVACRYDWVSGRCVTSLRQDDCRVSYGRDRELRVGFLEQLRHQG